MSDPRVLVITGLALCPLDPLLKELRAAGLHCTEAPFIKGKERNLAEALSNGDYQACIIPGLGSSSSFKPNRPTSPFVDEAWRKQLTSWVSAGGVLLMQGERAAAAVLSTWFGLPWNMDFDSYRRTDHHLNMTCPLVAGGIDRLPHDYEVKACMLQGVLPEQCVYGTAPNAVAHSTVFGPVPIQAGACAVAAAVIGLGSVVFWGDVNTEHETCQIVAQLTMHLLGGAAVHRPVTGEQTTAPSQHLVAPTGPSASAQTFSTTEDIAPLFNINIVFMWATAGEEYGQEVAIDIWPNTGMKIVFDAYCRHMSKNCAQVRFMYNGNSVPADSTALSLRLASNARINVYDLKEADTVKLGQSLDRNMQELEEKQLAQMLANGWAFEESLIAAERQKHAEDRKKRAKEERQQEKKAAASAKVAIAAQNKAAQEKAQQRKQEAMKALDKAAREAQEVQEKHARDIKSSLAKRDATSANACTSAATTAQPAALIPQHCVARTLLVSAPLPTTLLQPLAPSTGPLFQPPPPSATLPDPFSQTPVSLRMHGNKHPAQSARPAAPILPAASSRLSSQLPPHLASLWPGMPPSAVPSAMPGLITPMIPLHMAPAVLMTVPIFQNGTARVQTTQAHAVRVAPASVAAFLIPSLVQGSQPSLIVPQMSRLQAQDPPMASSVSTSALQQPTPLNHARADRPAAIPSTVTLATAKSAIAATTVRERNECVVCMEMEGGRQQRRFVTFAPCGHRVVCSECVNHFVGKFPCGTCQARVESYSC